MTTDITELAQSKALHKKLNRRLNDALGFQRTSGGKHATISLSINECKSVLSALDERFSLVEALEKAQRANSAQDDHINQQQDRIEQLEKGNQYAGKRIAEQESRTVTIEPFRSFVTDADLAALHRFAECCDDPESGGHDLEKEQVRRLEAIGALQRSGRISYITGFGDVLISITAGIKWEAE